MRRDMFEILPKPRSTAVGFQPNASAALWLRRPAGLTQADGCNLPAYGEASDPVTQRDVKENLTA